MRIIYRTYHYFFVAFLIASICRIIYLCMSFKNTLRYSKFTCVCVCVYMYECSLTNWPDLALVSFLLENYTRIDGREIGKKRECVVVSLMVKLRKYYYCVLNWTASSISSRTLAGRGTPCFILSINNHALASTYCLFYVD